LVARCREIRGPVRVKRGEITGQLNLLVSQAIRVTSAYMFGKSVLDAIVSNPKVLNAGGSSSTGFVFCCGR
jgi:hypothetical protein